MVKHLDNQVVYYYNSHPTEEDLMGETALHAAVIHYLVDVLRWLFADRVCAVHENLNFYVTSHFKEYPLAPDIAVIKGTVYHYIRSLSLRNNDPPPQVVFEIASKETWEKDLYEKPLRYAHMGVLEYVFYDPNVPPLHQSLSPHLFVWQLNQQLGTVRPLATNANGHIWSEQLESWLVPDGNFLRLLDRNGHLRLTQAESESQRAAEEARKANIAAQRAEVEARKANIAAQRAAEEARRANIEAQRAALLAEKLRSLGIDPETI